MKKGIFYAVLILLILSCQKGETSGKSGLTKTGKDLISKAPILKFEKTEHDFGEIKQTDGVRYDFKFKNTGKELLKITEVRASCGCTAAKLSKLEYKPGEEGVITASFNPSGFEAQVAKTIKVKSNDPLKPEIVLTIKAFILVPVKITPKYIDAGLLEYGSGVVREVTIMGISEKHFRIESVEFPKDIDFVEYKIEDISKPEYSSYRLIFTIQCQEKGRRSFNGAIRIKTDNPKLNNVTIGIRGTFGGAIKYDPMNLNMVIKQGDPMNGSITINSKIPVSITRVDIFTHEPSDIKYKLFTVTKGTMYNLNVYSDKPVQKPIRGTITIETDMPGLEPIKIPLNVTPRQ